MNKRYFMSFLTQRSIPPKIIALLICAFFVASTSKIQAELKIGDICRVKGQEENIFQGLGLVVGLSGTGDGDSMPTTQALAQMMSMMGAPLTADGLGAAQIGDLRKAKNVALAFVTAVSPPHGVRQGTRVRCVVNAVSAKSLQGGYLMMTPLLGPRPSANPAQRRVYALAHGPLQLPDSSQPATAVIEKGCLFEADFFNPFMSSDGAITLVLDEGHTGFLSSHEIVQQIRQEEDFFDIGDDPEHVAKALDAVNVRIKVPQKYLADPVVFVQAVLSLRLLPPKTEARVVVNERTGVIVLNGNVEIGPVAVSHKNLTIETGAPAAQFAPVDTSQLQTTSLRSLIDALSALRVPSQDVIEIIKEIQRAKMLYGKLVVQK